MNFTDNKGQSWEVVVSVGTAKACRTLLDIDICDLPTDFDLVQRLRVDDVLLANVLYVCCKEQAESRGVSDEAFGGLLVGDVIEQAEAALWEALTFFFRGVRREQLVKAIQIQKDLEAGALAELTPERQAGLIRKVKQAAGKTIDEILKEASYTNDA